MRKQLAAIFLCASCGAASPTSQAVDPKPTPKALAPGPGHAPTKEPVASDAQADARTPEALRAEAERLYKQAAAAGDDASAWQEAALALTRASKSAADETREREFLRSALSAWQELDRLAPSTKTHAETRELSPRTLPDSEISRMAVLARLAELTPAGDPELARIEYRRGRIFWNYDHHTEAVASFHWVVQQAPESPEGEYAAQLLLDSLALAHDLGGLQREVTAMLGNKKLLKGRDQLKERLGLVRHQVDRKSAEKLVQAENYNACAEAYLSLYGRDHAMPSVHGDELLYNASVCLERAGQTARAIKVLRELVKKTPQSPFAAKAKERAEALGTSR